MKLQKSVNCPACDVKTTGKLFQAGNVRVCETCSKNRKKFPKLKRVR